MSSNLPTDPVDLSGLQRAIDEAGWKMDTLRRLLEEAVPHLRELVSRCEGCDGAGVVVVSNVFGDPEYDREETCKICKDVQDLIERITPRLPKYPQESTVVEELDDDISF